MDQDVKKIVKISLLVVLFLFITTYAVFNTKNLIFGVKIKNVNIERGKDAEINIIKITGNAKNAKTLTLNGREISIDQKGDFNETLALLPGYNIMEIKAEGKFGDKDEKDYQLLGK